MEVTGPLVIGFIASFFLLAILALTAFVKIAVVLMIVRNALGLQQVPPNAVLMALALFLSIFISLPVLTQATAALQDVAEAPKTIPEFIRLWEIGISPFQAFLAQNVDPEQLSFFVGVTNDIWEGSGLTASEGDFIVQVPAFMLTELTEAFEIGFLIYLPFVAIDLAVTGILMALGMQMVQPNIIAVPFKLLIFVLVNGWAKLVHGLIQSYVGA